MAEQEPFYDAALIHGYWPSQRRAGPYTQGLRGRTVTRAAAYEFRRGSIGTIVITNGRVWGEDYDPVSYLMRRDLVNKFKIPEDKVLVSGDARTTEQEVNQFLDVARENSWHNLLDIAFRTHHLTIPQLYPDTDVTINFKSVEHIFREQEGRWKRKFMRKLSTSQYEVNFILYELIQMTFLRSGLRFLLRKKALSGRNQKHEGFLKQFPIDKYHL